MSQVFAHTSSFIRDLGAVMAFNYPLPRAQVPPQMPAQGSLAAQYGAKYLGVNKAPPSVVFVRIPGRFSGPEMNRGIQAPFSATSLNPPGAAKSPTPGRAIRSRHARFAAHLWGEPRPTDLPGFEGCDGAEDLIQYLGQALHLLSHGSYELDAEEWEEEGFTERGQLVVVTFEVRLPIVGMPDTLAQIIKASVTAKTSFPDGTVHSDPTFNVPPP